MMEKKTTAKVDETKAVKADDVKATVKEGAAAVKAAVKEVAAEVKEPVEEKKAVVKEVAAETKAAVKEVAQETKAVVKEVAEETKTAVKGVRGRKPGKTAAKKAVKEELKPEVFIQYQGNEVIVAEVIEKAKNAYVAEGHRVSSIKSLQVYLKPEEFAAYYVINQKVAGRVDLF